MKTNETLISDIKKLIDDVMDRSIYAKTELCKSESMTDNPPILFIGYVSDPQNPEHDSCLEAQDELELTKPYQMMMIPLIHKGDPTEAYEDVIRAMPIEPFDFLIIAVEGYSRDKVSKEEAYEILEERGSMEKDYKENPFTDVREAVIITAVDWEGTKILGAQTTYRYDDKGVPMWDEITKSEIVIAEHDSELGFGRLCDAMLGTVHYMHLATKALAYKKIIDQAPRKKR